MVTSLSKRTRFQLEFPIECDGRLYREISMRRAKPKDRTATYGATDLEAGYAFIARLCGVAPAVLRELHPSDLTRLADAAEAQFSRIE